MKKWLSYIILAVVCGMGLASCADENLVDGGGKVTSSPTFKLTLSLSGGTDEGALRAAGDYAGDGKDEQTDEQRYIANDDVYALEFDKDGVLQHVVSDLHFTDNNAQGKAERTLEGTLVPLEGKITLAVLANLKQNGISDALEMLKGKIGDSKQEVYESLIYTYPTSEWDVTQRYLPMHGEVTTTLASQITNLNCNIYRGVAKMGVENSAGNFTLKEIYVYYVNTQGYCVAPTKVPGEDDQYTEPEVPATSGQRAISERLKYTIADGAAQECLNRIYVSEANNKTPGEGKSALKIVVGGVFTGEGLVEEDGMSYYRIDMEDDETGEVAPFDIIRNHSYVFNITAVKNPGTPTPDEALDKDVVELDLMVGQWTDEVMQGISPQYTLTVDNSVFGFEGLTITKEILNIATDGTEWTLDTEKTDGDWFKLEETEHTATSGKVMISPSANITGEIRTGSFWVKAGKIEKKITIVQEPGETANCYLIRKEGTYLLKTDIKGNGRYKAWADNTGSETVEIDFGKGTALNVDHLEIIWETAEGLVTIDTPNKVDSETGCIPYTVHDVNDQWGYSVFTPGHGGNALIGGFTSGGELVWSWHIWVVGDYAKGINAEQWVTGMDFMDRNLGAYSNQPGIRSLGLLYQWGRKDPFIGAGELQRDYTKVKKAYTKNYTPHGLDSQWGTITGEETVLNSISQPTKILKNGFLSSNNVTMNKTKVKALWGTSSSSINVKDNGIKTMYDPCPPGYRVPSVHSWIFKTNGYNLYNNNYYYNSRYVPYRGNDGWDSSNYGSESFTSDSPYYGFWIEYGTNKSQTAPAVIEYGDNTYSRDQWGMLKSGASSMTWLPLGGVYNGDMESFGSVGGYSSLHVNSIVWLNAPSAANSSRPAGVFLHGTEGECRQTTSWEPETRISTEDFYVQDDKGDYVVDSYKNNDSGTYQQQMYSSYFVYRGSGGFEGQHYEVTFRKRKGTDWFALRYSKVLAGGTYEGLKETETYKDSNGSKGNGRHLHELDETDDDLLALPQYAGSVRCVRDKDAIKSVDNVISKQNITLSSQNSYEQQLNITAVESWRVVNPGKKWVIISPDNGGIGKTTLKISSRDHSVRETATITIKFARGSEQTITVTQQ